MSLNYLLPLFIIGGLLVVAAIVFGLLVLLGRIRGGRYLRPLVAVMSKVPWLRRQIQKLSEATIERQNPELASAMRKLQRAGSNPTPQQAQQALSRLSASERRAYLDAVGEQGGFPETNRQQRRLQRRLQQGGRPSGSSGRRGKRRS